MKRYVLITPARNEEGCIEKTLQAMVGQTIQPVRWIIVNDGSTDGTEKIIERYTASHEFIVSIHVERSGDRHFGNKVHAFDRGLAMVRDLDYEFIGNLDADISVENDYFSRLFDEFEKDEGLGLAGGMVSSYIDGKFVSQDVALDSVAGAVQLFRRRCFEEIGGYVPLPLGGIDAAAEIMARMNGWKVRTFPELRVLEHRRTGSGKAGPLAAKVQEGRRFYSLGYGLAFYFVRCLYRLLEQPMFWGSGAALVGFLKGMVRAEPIVLPREVVEYLRAEQREKLLRRVGLR